MGYITKFLISLRSVKILHHAGWIAFFLLLGTVCFLYRERSMMRVPSSRSPDFKRRLASERERLTTFSWRDQRPLCLFLGDSQVELGNWYELFSGRHAVINAGVSMARVADVASVVAQGTASKIDTVVLMCGINDLGSSEKTDRVRQDFEGLLDLIAAKIRPRRTIVLSVMPVLVSGPGDRSAISCNESVNDLNLMLASMVRSKGAEFLDLTPLVWQGRGMNPELTSDGLHPNRKGYAVIGDAVGRALGDSSLINPKTSNP